LKKGHLRGQFHQHFTSSVFGQHSSVEKNTNSNFEQRKAAGNNTFVDKVAHKMLMKFTISFDDKN